MADYFEAEVAHPLMQGTPNMAQLVLAVALDFARTRGLGDLTAGRPKLGAWRARISALPSIQATATR
jgi:glutathione S-transferase